MEWRRTEARIVTMLHTCHVTPVHHWRLRLIESELRRAIEMKPAPPIVTATGVDRRTREEWHWQMQCRHLELMELEQSFRVLFEPDPTNVDADPSTTLELTIEQPHVPPQNPRETAEQQLVSVNLQLHTTAESDSSSPILILHTETLLTEVSRAQSESELMDDEEACVVDDIDAHYGFSVLGVLPTDRPPPEPGQELIDEEEACTGITESTIDALTAALQVIDEKSCAVDAIDGDYRCPVLRVLPTDRPPPEPGQELMDKEACAVNAIGADQGLPLPVRRACAGITESTIDAFPAPSQVPVPFQVRKKHELAIEDPMGGYALPVPQLVPTNRAPPKPGEALKFLAHGSTTTSTTRTIKLKAIRRDRLGRLMAKNGTESKGRKRTVKGEG